jgi:hypothetical protein
VAPPRQDHSYQRWTDDTDQGRQQHPPTCSAATPHWVHLTSSATTPPTPGAPPARSHPVHLDNLTPAAPPPRHSECAAARTHLSAPGAPALPGISRPRHPADTPGCTATRPTTRRRVHLHYLAPAAPTPPPPTPHVHHLLAHTATGAPPRPDTSSASPASTPRVHCYSPHHSAPGAVHCLAPAAPTPPRRHPGAPAARPTTRRAQLTTWRQPRHHTADTRGAPPARPNHSASGAPPLPGPEAAPPPRCTTCSPHHSAPSHLHYPAPAAPLTPVHPQKLPSPNGVGARPRGAGISSACPVGRMPWRRARLAVKGEIAANPSNHPTPPSRRRDAGAPLIARRGATQCAPTPPPSKTTHHRTKTKTTYKRTPTATNTCTKTHPHPNQEKPPTSAPRPATQTRTKTSPTTEPRQPTDKRTPTATNT